MQSSGAHWTVTFSPRAFIFGVLASALLNVAGAPASLSAPYTFMRIAACGQMMEHCPHWMHTDGSHCGMNAATLRFSHCVVAVGHVPSSGMAETGSSLPFCAIIFAVTFLMKSGAASATIGGILSLPAGAAGYLTSSMAALAASMHFQFISTTSWPFLEYAFSA